MAKFSIGDAAVDGFRQIGRHWRMVLGWSFFMLVSMVGVLILAVMLGVMLAVSGLLAASTAGGVVGGLLAFFVMMLLAVMLQAAVWRLLLRPEEPVGFFRLHVGRDELRLFGFTVLMFLGFGVLLLPSVFVRLATPASAWPQILSAVLGGAVGVWLMLRLALTSPIIMDGGGIDLRRSWRLTRGRAWVLFGTAVLTCFLIFLVSVVETVVMGVGAIATMGWSGVGALVNPNAADPSHTVFGVVQGVIQLLLWPAFVLLWQAPLAVAYSAFSSPDEA